MLGSGMILGGSLLFLYLKERAALGGGIEP